MLLLLLAIILQESLYSPLKLKVYHSLPRSVCSEPDHMSLSSVIAIVTIPCPLAIEIAVSSRNIHWYNCVHIYMLTK